MYSFARRMGVGMIRTESLLPKQAEFEDYAALAYHDCQLAVVSQASSRRWVARIDGATLPCSLIPGSRAIYRFPSKSYGNVEGIAWLTADTLIAVSDRRKKGQPNRFAKKDQFDRPVKDPCGITKIFTARRRQVPPGPQSNGRTRHSHADRRPRSQAHEVGSAADMPSMVANLALRWRP